MQKWLVTLMVLGAATANNEENNDSCYSDVHSLCQGQLDSTTKCNAKYGGALENEFFGRLNGYIEEQILTSFKYLFMSSNFGTYVRNRDGFAKLFKKLSDESWEDAISLIKFSTKRGGSVNVQHRAPATLDIENDEVKALSKALDLYKKLANSANTIHREIMTLNNKVHDAELASYIEKEFVHKHASTVRDLAGYTSDMTKLSEVSNPGLSVFMFDEYLQKVLS